MNWIVALFAAALSIAFSIYSDITMTRCEAKSFWPLIYIKRQQRPAGRRSQYQ
jgi:hypothetical protein